MSRRNRSPMNGYYALRWAVLERDDFTCQYCGQKAPNVKLEVDHVIPVAEQGEDTMENLKTSCYACNRGRSALSIRLKSKGQTPRRYGALQESRPPRWRQLAALSVVQSSITGISPTILANALRISQPNANQILARLIRTGSVKRKGRGLYISSPSD